MSSDIVSRIRRTQPTPIIGVIGATAPSKDYEKQLGIEVGYELRKEMEQSHGSIFTGGVDGVGVDVYIGVLKYCIEQSQRNILKRKTLEDKFFLLIPEFDWPIVNGAVRKLLGKQTSYLPPDAYVDLSYLSAQGSLTLVRAGEDLEERRQYVAGVADVLVMLNGGFGTLDEALSAIRVNTPVVVFSQSGGTASILQSISEEGLPLALERRLVAQGFTDLNSIDRTLVYPVSTPQEMCAVLRKIC